MFINLLVLLIVLAITFFFGRLTYRAVKAQRMWVKILGGLGAGLLTLVFAALSFWGIKGMMMVYSPKVSAAPDLKVDATPEQIARGEYIASIGCVGCHGVNQAFPLTGGWNMAADEGFGFMGQAATENLTPGGKLANYTDGEIFRAIRYGVDKDGNLLLMMSSLSYRELSDDDIEAVIAYLRSQPAEASDAPTGDKLNFLGMVIMGSGMFPVPAPAASSIDAPPAGATPEYGKYVATVGDCRGCHGSNMEGTPASSFGPAIPNPRVFVGTITLEEFIQTMRTGARPDGTPFTDAMPWQSAAQMTDDDLAALYAYLTAEP
ncbi:MAG: c-type cytochrome [Anaerolineales bacterium]|nr:MAG: c-type cytochrome [Anaerolineales bacterium]